MKYRTLHCLYTDCHTYYDVRTLPCVPVRRKRISQPAAYTAHAFTLQPFCYGIGWRFGTWSNRAALCESWRQD